MSDDGETEYGLLVPFVVVESHGGPYDDASYVAGYEMGGFGQRCAAAAALNLLPFTITIRLNNVRQADLLAMQCGLVSTVEQLPEVVLESMTGWAVVTVNWAAGDGPGA